MNIDDVIASLGCVCDYCNYIDVRCDIFCFTSCGYMYLKAYEMILDGMY